MKCLFFAINKFLKEGGYLVIRRSKFSRLLPHFLWMKDDESALEHFQPDSPRKMWLCPLWPKGQIIKGDK